ncbi:hypothetical protein AURDEDRAFT_180596 [Auricularia subglabra TFB-10046 SS5]|nr:hypothetical protein AURDEDRAFT_180596 [Auricularia subglabra TFB-10046 SS5]
MSDFDNLLCAVTGHSPPHLFRVSGADCSRLEKPTIANLLEDIAEDHHVHCGCHLKIASSVWPVHLPPTHDALSQFDSQTVAAIPLDTPLATLHRPGKDCVHLVVSAETCCDIDHVDAYRKRSFVTHRTGNATVWQRVGTQLRFPEPDPGEYEDLCRIRGVRVVDKTEQLFTLLSHFDSPRLAVIRRPKGYGKTTFLSMFRAFFDVASRQAYFPCMHPSHDLPPFVSDARGSALVFSLDFAKFNLDRGWDLDSVELECSRVVSEAALEFFVRYADVLNLAPGSEYDPNFSPTLSDAVHSTRSHGWRFCLTIDNYTAPLERGPILAFERAVRFAIFGFIHQFMRNSDISFGLIVGSEVSLHEPWSDTPCFEHFVCDLTRSPLLSRAIGLTRDEIIALGHSADIDLWAHIGPSVDSEADWLFSPRDVVRMARGLAHGLSPSLAPLNAVDRTVLELDAPTSRAALHADQVALDALLEDICRDDDPEPVSHSPRHSMIPVEWDFVVGDYDHVDPFELPGREQPEGAAPSFAEYDGSPYTFDDYDYDDACGPPACDQLEGSASPAADYARLPDTSEVSENTLALGTSLPSSPAQKLSSPRRGIVRHCSPSLTSSPGKSDTSSRRDSESLFSRRSDASSHFTEPPSPTEDPLSPK